MLHLSTHSGKGKPQQQLWVSRCQRRGVSSCSLPQPRGVMDFTESQPDRLSQTTALGNISLLTPWELWKIPGKLFFLKKTDELILLLALWLVFLKLVLSKGFRKQTRLPSTIFQNHSQSCSSNTPSDFQKKIDQISEVLSGCCCLLQNWGCCLVPQRRAADLAQISHSRDGCQIRALPEF